MGFGVWGLWFGVWGLGFGVRCLGEFRDEGSSGFRVEGVVLNWSYLFVNHSLWVFSLLCLFERVFLFSYTYQPLALSRSLVHTDTHASTHTSTHAHVHKFTLRHRDTETRTYSDTHV